MNRKKIKVCGMKDPGNVTELVQLNPDYIGFILYEKSPRYITLKTAENLVKNIPDSVQRVGVLVNMPIEEALTIARTGVFDILQLHGDESPDYCRQLSENVNIIKAFGVSDRLPEFIETYQPFCKMFLFDAAGSVFGGTGKKFDHSILAGYNLDKQYLLSGGISENDASELRNYPDRMAGVDLNSRFEVCSGIKNIIKLKEFIEKIRSNDND